MLSFVSDPAMHKVAKNPWLIYVEPKTSKPYHFVSQFHLLGLRKVLLEASTPKRQREDIRRPEKECICSQILLARSYCKLKTLRSHDESIDVMGCKKWKVCMDYHYSPIPALLNSPDGQPQSSVEPSSISLPQELRPISTCNCRNFPVGAHDSDVANTIGSGRIERSVKADAMPTPEITTTTPSP